MTKFRDAASPVSILHWHQLKEKAIARLKSQRTRAQSGHGEHRPKGRTYGKSHIAVSGLLATSFIIFLEFLVLESRSPNENPELPFYEGTTEKFLTIRTGENLTAKLWLLIHFSVNGLKRLIMSRWSRGNLILGKASEKSAKTKSTGK